MNKKNFYELHSSLCKTLSHPKRQKILNTLRKSKMTVNELVERTGIPQSNLSQHLSILRSKGVLIDRRAGVNVYYSISNAKIIKAFDLISEVLKENLASQSEIIGNGPAEIL